MKRLLCRKVLVACVLLACWAPAYAYIDPGTGSALIQGLIAAIAAIGVTLRLYWHRVLGVFRKKEEPKTADLSSSAESNET